MMNCLNEETNYNVHPEIPRYESIISIAGKANSDSMVKLLL